MLRSRSREETEWLGGETLVRSHPHEPRFSFLRGVIAGGVVLLASVGFGYLVRSVARKQVRQSRRELSQTAAEIRASKPCADAVSVMAIGAAWGVGMVAGAVTAFLAVTEASDCIHTRSKRTISTVSDESDRLAEAGKRDRAW